MIVYQWSYRFQSAVGGQRCPESVRNYCVVSVGQNQVQIRNPNTRKPSRLQILTDRYHTVNSDSVVHRRLVPFRSYLDGQPRYENKRLLKCCFIANGWAFRHFRKIQNSNFNKCNCSMWNQCIECCKEIYCFQDKIHRASIDGRIFWKISIFLRSMPNQIEPSGIHLLAIFHNTCSYKT